MQNIVLRICLTALVALQPNSGRLGRHARPGYGVNGGPILYVTYSRCTGPSLLRCAWSLSNSIARDILRVGNVPKRSTIGFCTLLDCLVSRE